MNQVAKQTIDPDLLLKISKLNTGPLYERRKQIRNSIVYSIVFSKEIKSIFSINEIFEEITEKTKLRIDKGLISSIVMEYVKDGLLKSSDNVNFKINKKKSLQSSSSILNPIWEEFEEYLKQQDKNYDIYLSRDVKGIFKNVVAKLILMFNLENGELHEQFSFIDEESFNQIVTDTVKKSNFDNTIEKKLPKVICDYFNLKTEKFKSFIFNCYSAIINIDLLRNVQKIPKLNFIDQLIFLLADTNFITALLCETHEDHILTKIISDHCDNGGIPIFYSDITDDQMKSLIYSTKSEINGKYKKKKHSVIISPFITDSLNKNMEWNNYVIIIDNWKEIIDEKYSIRKLTCKWDIDIDEEVYCDIKKRLALYDRIRENQKTKQYNDYIPEYRNDLSLNHDATCLSLIAKIKNDTEKKQTSALGPWFLTFDNIILFWNESDYSFHKDEFGYAIHPKILMDYLLTFSKVKYDKKDEQKVAEALLDYTCGKRESELTIEKYSKLITQKLKLPIKSSKIIEKIFFGSPLRYNLEKSLIKDRGEEVDEITSKIFENEDLINKVMESGDLKDRVKNLSIKVRELTIQKEEAEKIASTMKITLDINLDVKIKAKFNALIEILESEEVFQDGSLSKPNEISKKEKLKEWLEHAKTILEGKKEITEGLKIAIPLITQILSKLY